MMKVFVVVDHDTFGTCEIVRVYATERDARAYAATDSTFEVESHEVRTPDPELTKGTRS